MDIQVVHNVTEYDREELLTGLSVTNGAKLIHPSG